MILMSKVFQQKHKMDYFMGMKDSKEHIFYFWMKTIDKNNKQFNGGQKVYVMNYLIEAQVLK